MNKEAWLLLGELLQENDQDDLAIVVLGYCYEADPQDPRCYRLLGISKVNTKQWDQAIIFFTRWLMEHPDFKDLPVFHEVDDEFDMAKVMRAFTDARLKKPDNEQVLVCIGILKFMLEDFL